MALYLLIAVGSALGGVSRFALSGWVARHWGVAFPWGTLVVNVLGAFAIGFFSTLTGPDGRFVVGGPNRHFFMTGVLGGFTTFSTFSLQTLGLARNDEWLLAGANVVASVAVCLVAAWLGHLLAAVLSQPR